jgi:hypothetical protein
MDAKGYMIAGTVSSERYFDVYNPAARDLFYSYNKEAMFK